MQKLLAILILLSHINFSMFIPQVDEVDSFDVKGKPVDDINSLFGFIDQVVLGHTHSSPDDEDDDNARYFHLIKGDDYSYIQNIIKIKKPELSLNDKNNYPLFLTGKMPSGFYEIQSPPPEGSSLS